MKLAEISTPAVLVDMEVARRNVESFQAYVSGHGLKGRPHIKTHKLPRLAELQLAAGAVGDVLGYVLDAEGRPVGHPINERVIGVELEDLRGIPDVILAAGGLHKVPILKAVLGLGLVDTLVTDENTARAVMGVAE